jgi:hypothetical protein
MKNRLIIIRPRYEKNESGISVSLMKYRLSWMLLAFSDSRRQTQALE